ncbi:putative membrane protein [Francisella philomiragia subsp. philomiragia ATCC 25015]|uniref:hypothetical protein n=1 Tax=Francisella philomiragia TaxID=28110 RepID=UPI0001AF76C1|nr:hypothetical protein [Francisella philomiragia]AJI74129.1 putative membrane protein [Francisella philomiragia subsp. philomiragia ATCC 25015]MBK2238440.1 hypothetical protein [Francisella philomiragia]
MLKLSKRECFVEITKITIFFISLFFLFFFDGGFYSNLTLKLVCACVLGSSFFSAVAHIYIKKAYQTIDKLLSKLIKSIFLDISAFKDLVGYILICGFLKKFTTFIAAGVFFFILAAGYYQQQHFRSVLGIDKNIFQGSFSDNFYAVNGIITLLFPSIKWFTILFFTSVAILFFICILFALGAFLTKYADQNENRLFTRCLGQLLSLFALVPFVWLCVMIIITPLGIAELSSRDTAEDVVFSLLEKDINAKLLFTDQNYNYVIYPKERVFCRTLLDESFFSIEEVSSKKLLGYKCFILGDETFRKDLLEKITQEEQEKSKLIKVMGEKSYQRLVNAYE